MFTYMINFINKHKRVVHVLVKVLFNRFKVFGSIFITLSFYQILIFSSNIKSLSMHLL